MQKTAGIFIFDETNKLLICRATNSNNFSIPKGHVDEGETVLKAALRETVEETSLDLKELKSELIELTPVKYRKRNKTLYSFFIKLNTKINVKKLKCESKIDGKDEPEIDYYELVTVEEAFEKIHEAQVKVLNEIIQKGLL